MIFGPLTSKISSSFSYKKILKTFENSISNTKTPSNQYKKIKINYEHWLIFFIVNKIMLVMKKIYFMKKHEKKT